MEKNLDNTKLRYIGNKFCRSLGASLCRGSTATVRPDSLPNYSLPSWSWSSSSKRSCTVLLFGDKVHETIVQGKLKWKKEYTLVIADTTEAPALYVVNVDGTLGLCVAFWDIIHIHTEGFQTYSMIIIISFFHLNMIRLKAQRLRGRIKMITI